MQGYEVVQLAVSNADGAVAGQSNQPPSSRAITLAQALASIKAGVRRFQRPPLAVRPLTPQGRAHRNSALGATIQIFPGGNAPRMAQSLVPPARAVQGCGRLPQRTPPMIRPCIPFPDKRLRTPAAPVDSITDDIRRIWDDMIDTMEAMPGVGLAAPQIGVMLRLAVVDASDTRGQAIRMANPEILHASGQLREHEEASPNLPGVAAVISRPRAVTVRFLNEHGAIEDRDFVHLWATSVQHQIDHLNGRMYVDRLSPLKRQMLLKRAAVLARRG